MPIKYDTINRVYWSIGEVAETLEVHTSKLRYYESEFKLRIKKNRKGERAYSDTDIKKLERLVFLSSHLKLNSVKLVIENKAKFEIL